MLFFFDLLLSGDLLAFLSSRSVMFVILLGLHLFFPGTLF